MPNILFRLVHNLLAGEQMADSIEIRNPHGFAFAEDGVFLFNHSGSVTTPKITAYNNYNFLKNQRNIRQENKMD